MSDLPLRVGFARRMAAGDPSLRLYAILDVESCTVRGLDLVAVATAWHEAGISLLQLRDKRGSDDDVLRSAERVANVFRTPGSILLLNDRAHLVRRAGWDGVHIGQGDGGIVRARDLAGNDAILGLSTHTPEQAEAAHHQDVDYVACGPVYATTTKADAEPVIGLCGLQAVRAMTGKPLVAIGGITLQHAPKVRKSGANSVALISALLPASGSSISELTQRAAAFLQALRQVRET